MIKGVIFDMDGLMFDTERIWATLWRPALATLGLSFKEGLDAAAGDDAEAQKHELGDLIFSNTEMGRRKGIKASEALELATARFLRRFARMEDLARQLVKDFPDLSLDEMDELGNAAKEEEKAAH